MKNIEEEVKIWEAVNFEHTHTHTQEDGREKFVVLVNKSSNYKWSIMNEDKKE